MEQPCETEAEAQRSGGGAVAGWGRVPDAIFLQPLLIFIFFNTKQLQQLPTVAIVVSSLPVLHFPAPQFLRSKIPDIDFICDYLST